ncbi:MAG TPA: flagellar hook-basal body complex protein FliE [Solirubrobacteraceae bacterium]|nr:flagellar hook-basal body complex protein FliE [Solirubrobacteraceae bacterium]
MIIPPVGGIGGGLSLGGTEALAHGAGAASSAVAPAGEAGTVAGGEAGAVSGSESGSFGGALGEAISSLEKTQQSAEGASQALATGTVKDPESAVVTVEDASMAMDLAAQLRGKATEAIQTIFSTQV